MKKFSYDRVEAIKNYIIGALGLYGGQIPRADYRKRTTVFTSRHVLAQAREMLKDEGIELYSSREFFESSIKPIIEEQF